MIIPVIDLKNGLAVSGQSGNRETYKPLETVFHPSSNPMKIAEALKNQGAKEIYIADLDAIDGVGSNLELVESINRVLPVMLDCGAHEIETVCKAMEVASKVIVATETLRSLEELHEICYRVNKNRILISVDVKDDKIFSEHLELDFKRLKEELGELKPSAVILLDISRVGTGQGINKELIQRFSGLDISIIFGGGVTPSDLAVLSDLGVEKVLVGTVLHQGKMKLQF